MSTSDIVKELEALDGIANHPQSTNKTTSEIVREQAQMGRADGAV
jgi:hypothetical protein